MIPKTFESMATTSFKMEEINYNYYFFLNYFDLLFFKKIAVTTK